MVSPLLCVIIIIRVILNCNLLPYVVKLYTRIFLLKTKVEIDKTSKEKQTDNQVLMVILVNISLCENLDPLFDLLKASAVAENIFI